MDIQLASAVLAADRVPEPGVVKLPVGTIGGVTLSDSAMELRSERLLSARASPSCRD